MAPNSISIDNSAASYAITLGAGSDILSLYKTNNPIRGGFTILDFTTGDGGDQLGLYYYLLSLLSGWDPDGNPFAGNYARLGQQGANTVLLIDTSGGGSNFKLLGTLAGVDAHQLTEVNLGFAPVGPVAVAGTNGNDILAGTAGGDEIVALDGDDRLDGRQGVDRLKGGGGNDIYIVDAPGDIVVETASAAAATRSMRERPMCSPPASRSSCSPPRATARPLRST